MVGSKVHGNEAPVIGGTNPLGREGLRYDCSVTVDVRPHRSPAEQLPKAEAARRTTSSRNVQPIIRLADLGGFVGHGHRNALGAQFAACIQSPTPNFTV